MQKIATPKRNDSGGSVSSSIDKSPVANIRFNAQIQDDAAAAAGFSSASEPSTPLTGTSTPDTSTDVETEGSDYMQHRHHHSPKTSMTITTTTTTSDGETETGTGTSVQYSGVKGLSVSQGVGKDGKLLITPLPSRKDRKVKVKKVISFTPRISHFDRYHPTSQGDTFRGFYVLFWLMMGLTMTRVLYHSYLNTGEMVGLRFARLISADAIALALSDAVLVGSTVLCVPFVKLMKNGWFRYHYTGLILQHLGQSAFLATAITWTFYRQWYWVQSGFLTLHSLTMLMKVHSYLAMNGALSEKAILLKKATADLDKAIEEKGGWSKVLFIAQQEAEALEAEAKEQNSPSLDGGSSPVRANSTSALANGHSTLSTSGPADGLRRRRSSNKSGTSQTNGLHHHGAVDANNPRDPRRLLDYSNDRIYNLAHDCVDLQEELKSTGKEGVMWPANVTYANYIDYLIVPTLVYELEYPRTTTIRPLYVLEKTLATFGTFFIILAITEHVIIPNHEASKANPLRADSFLAAALDLVMPFMINYLLIFYIIFECICNGFAELGRFADRGFYEDWWNAVTWDEFARKWNKPVHQFLLRHVYSSTIAAFRLSKFQASFVTFLLSACVHELVMAVVSKKFRMYLFAMQMMQLPMIAIGRLRIMRKYPTVGNIFFWAGLIWGFPLLAVGYLRF